MKRIFEIDWSWDRDALVAAQLQSQLAHDHCCHVADITDREAKVQALIEACQEFIEWGSCTGSDLDLHRNKFSKLIAALKDHGKGEGSNV